MQNAVIAGPSLMTLTRWAVYLGAALFVMPVLSAQAEIVRSETANPHDPHGFYGGCIPGGNAGVARKTTQIGPGGHTLKNVIGITVLECHAFDGGEGQIVPCPPGTNFTYCIMTGNDGLGNHIEVGVTEAPTDRTCRVGEKRPGPPAQMDIVFDDAASGIASIELRGPVTNARSQPYAVGSDRDPIVITFTKINQGLTANVPNIIVTNGSGVVTNCDFSF